MSRDFKGIWIPKEVWLNKDLTIMEKVFLVEISSLDNEQGCFASNGYFAEFFGLTPQRCSQIINSLIKKDIIKATYIREGKEIVRRVLRIFDTYKENFKKVSSKCEEGIKETFRGYKENVKDNNTYNNTPSNTSIINNKPNGFACKMDSIVKKDKKGLISFWCNLNKLECDKDDKFCMSLYNKVCKLKKKEFKDKGLDVGTRALYPAIINEMKKVRQDTDSWFWKEWKTHYNFSSIGGGK